MESEELKRYLFLQLSDDDRQAVEERFLEDADYFDEMLDLENDLVDGYVRGALAAEDRQSFEQTLSKLPVRRAKLDNARILHTYISNEKRVSNIAAEERIPQPELEPTVWQKLFAPFRVQYALGFLTVLLICTIVILFYQNRRAREELAVLQKNQSTEIAEKERLLQQQTEELEKLKQAADGVDGENEILTERIGEIEKQNERLEKELKALRNQSPGNQDKPNRSPKTVFAFLLPGTGSKGGNRATVTVGANAARILFNLQIPPASQAVAFNVRLNGRPVGAENLKARRTQSGRRVLSLNLPASEFGNGDYQLTVTGNDGFEDNYSFRIQKQ